MSGGRHPYAEHLDRVAVVEAELPIPAWQPGDPPMPVLYLGHGAPPLLEDALWMRQLHDWARALPRPRAVLIVSAHWESAPIGISRAEAGGELVYDFGGFDPMYYRLRYDIPDATELARMVRSVMPAGETVHEHTSRGLDHGAWIPLMVMYPWADVPVIQMSLPTEDPVRLMALGGRLRPLREQGVLVIGSGFMTHGLPYLTRDNWTGRSVPGWSTDFDAWAAGALARGDVDELARYRTAAPGLPYAHPTVEHFTPLFVTLGAATRAEDPVETVIEGYAMGLAKRSIQAA